MNMRLLAVPMAVFLLVSCGGGGGKSSPPLRISPAAPPTAADRTLPGERQTPPPGSEFEDPPDRNADHRFDPNEPDPGFFPSLGPGGDSSRPGPPEPPPGSESDPAHHLTTPRFTLHQPRVLEQIGAHHAYARGLTGRGVRIGIQDTIVDYTQTGEFGSRVLLRRSDGAVLSYRRPFGDDPASEISICEAAGTCEIFTGDSEGDGEARNRWVREIASQVGWPPVDDFTFIVDEHYSALDPFLRLLRWSEVPTPYGEGDHGTSVASTAAGANLGVAPEATIIPVATNLSDDPDADPFANAEVRQAIARMSATNRAALDDDLAEGQRDEYARFDIINRSYGVSLYDQQQVIEAIAGEVAWFRLYLPKFQEASWQVDRTDREKTIIVYAAGNDGEFYSGLGADLPYHIPELRGHSLSVVATDPQTGAIAGYSNLCGPVPGDWNAGLHGPHYCLAAPGTVRGLIPDPASPGNGNVEDGVAGTSFAAPVVSGGLALLMEQFRSTRGNTEIVKRMLDTADRTGIYANAAIYGAGHLDLETALSPVGFLSVGQTLRPLRVSSLRTPVAYGAVSQRAASLELAAFDEQDFPFWVPLSGLIAEGESGRSPIPQFETLGMPSHPAHGLETLDQRWLALAGTGSHREDDGSDWVVGFGPQSASVARQPAGVGWGYGVNIDGGGHLGAEVSGAFGEELQSSLVWATRSVERRLPGGLEWTATGTLAVSLPQYEKDAIFRATPSVLSAASMRVGTGSTGLLVEQPLRAESGTGRFRVETGWIEDGQRLHDDIEVPLRPDVRELRMTLRHDVGVPGGTLAFAAAVAVNAGHVRGARETTVGAAYRAMW